jgi:hypothetical protein
LRLRRSVQTPDAVGMRSPNQHSDPPEHDQISEFAVSARVASLGIPQSDAEPRAERDLIVEADRIVARLSPGKRESVREIVIDAVRRGRLTPGGRLFIERVTETSLVADLLEAELAANRSHIAPDDRDPAAGY